MNNEDVDPEEVDYEIDELDDLDEDTITARAPSVSYDETPNADRLVARYGADMRYCTERKAYYVWDGRRWVWDDFRQVERWAESTLLYEQATADKIRNKKVRQATKRAITKACNRAPLQSMIHLAKKKVKTVSINEFDADPWILNCNNGIVLLKTGELIPHNREALCSRLIPIDYKSDADCPQFDKFLFRIMGGQTDKDDAANKSAHDLTDCLQRLMGCAATGVFEKILVVLFGSGNNGKTTFLEVAREVLGGEEYAGEVQIGTLMNSGAQNVSNNAAFADIADLKGCRLVTSSEPEEGHSLSVARVKYVTGGGQIKARYLRENHFTFQPSHKIFLDTNHPPVVGNANDAVWNRVKCIPFAVSIPRAEIDTELPAKLRQELPGILSWVVRGAVLYHACGLYFPAAVELATEEYRVKSDHLPSFLDDVCDLDASKYVPVTQLWITYERWINLSGEDKLSQTQFKQRMIQAGFKYERAWVTTQSKRQQVRVWKGLSVRDFKVAMSLKPSRAK